MHFLALNLEYFSPDRNYFTRSLFEAFATMVKVVRLNIKRTGTQFLWRPVCIAQVFSRDGKVGLSPGNLMLLLKEKKLAGFCQNFLIAQLIFVFLAGCVKCNLITIPLLVIFSSS